VDRLSTLARRYAVEALVVLAAVVAMLDVALRDGAGQPGTSDWLAVPAMAVIILPLLGQRRFPFAAPLAVWLAAAATSFVDGRLLGFAIGGTVAGLAAAVLIGNLRDERLSRIGLVIVVASTMVIVYNEPGHAAGNFVFTPLLFVVGWLAGYALRSRDTQARAAEERAAQAEREREVAARIAVAEERARIARELHDIVAHAVSVMVLQVGAVRHRLPAAQHEDADALRDVEQAGRSALAEMRRLLGALRDADEQAELAPQPGLDRIGKLAAEVERSGLPVHVVVDGEPYELPRALDLSAYRIVQEGLTNALKHASASRADVTVTYRPDELCIEVRDDGTGGGAAGSNGHGLVGVRERVKVYGGEMTASTPVEGGFVLATRLPVRERS
jgi:signal transduction histidine kinase